LGKRWNIFKDERGKRKRFRNDDLGFDGRGPRAMDRERRIEATIWDGALAGTNPSEDDCKRWSR
jgi:hypothetical protein